MSAMFKISSKNISPNFCIDKIKSPTQVMIASLTSRSRLSLTKIRSCFITIVASLTKSDSFILAKSPIAERADLKVAISLVQLSPCRMCPQYAFDLGMKALLKVVHNAPMSVSPSC